MSPHVVLPHRRPSPTSAFATACLAGLLLIGSPAVLHAQAASSAYLKALSGKTPPSPLCPPDAATDSAQPATFAANEGPWGSLRCFYIFLEAPVSLMETFPLPNTKPRWSFTKAQAADLPNLFEKAGLPKAFATTMLDPKNQLVEAGMVHLFPPLEDLEGMTPAMREVIYPELAKNPINEYHADPVLITTDSVEEWYRSSGLRAELVNIISRMAYKRGECLVFSDLSAILNHARTSSEARMIFKAFTRTRSLMVHLELRPGEANIDQLLDYWTTGLSIRRKDIEPIMRSIIDTAGVEHLGLVHILPALVRKLLYTYPSQDMLLQGTLPDCHWTTLNFFNYTPQDYLLDSRLATSKVLEDFNEVKPPYRYGDILFFVDSEKGDAFHSCVYIADDIVYTKNGRNLLSPWLLMKLEDVKKIYLYRGNGRVQGFRHKVPDRGDGGN